MQLSSGIVIKQQVRGPIQRQRREGRGAIGAKAVGVWRGAVPLPNGVGPGEVAVPPAQKFLISAHDTASGVNELSVTNWSCF